jgi:6-phosphogluconolactonase
VEGTIEDLRFYLGTYTSAGGRGIGTGRIDPATGRPEIDGWNSSSAEPSWLDVAADGRTLYAVGELTPDGQVSALRVAPDGGLTLLNTVPTGAKPAHLAIHPDGRFLFTALYDGGGVTLHALEPDGSLGPAREQHRHSDPEPTDPELPGSVSHAHQVVIDPVGGDVLVVDLGTDSLHRYRFDPALGRLTGSGRTQLATGSGPRHLVFHPTGSHAYVAGELDSTVTICARTAGTWQPVSVLPALAMGLAHSGPNYPGEIVISADGRFVYVSNRGSNTISVFAVGADGREPGALTLVSTSDCGGDWPRHLALEESGRWLYVANERSGDLAWFPLDPGTGLPGSLAGRLAVPGIAQFHLRQST